MSEFREALFVSLVRQLAFAPRFRGRNRALLALYGALGLSGKHIFVETTLQNPVACRVRLDLHSWLQRVAFLDGGYEPDCVDFLLRLHAAVDDGGALLDIGANVGLIALPAALMMRKRGVAAPQVVAIEAIADNIAALRHNVALNAAAENVVVLHAPLGDVAKTVNVQVEGDLRPGEGTGTANILPDDSILDPAGKYSCERFPLGLTTLDALMSEGRLPVRISAIKIDADGYDLKILQGGSDFLAARRPVIFGEFSAHCLAWHGQSLADAQKFCERLGYRLWARQAPHWRFVAPSDAKDYVQDLLLAPIEKASLVSAFVLAQ